LFFSFNATHYKKKPLVIQKKSKTWT
jgi:hypothetical protein